MPPTLNENQPLAALEGFIATEYFGFIEIFGMTSHLRQKKVEELARGWLTSLYNAHPKIYLLHIFNLTGAIAKYHSLTKIHKDSVRSIINTHTMASLPHTTNCVNSTEETVSVAIIGGGIGGLCLALGLLKQPHLDVQVYEAAHIFSEIGAGVALGHNAERALELIGPAAKHAMEKHATGNIWASHSNTFADYKVVSRVSVTRHNYIY